MLNADISVRCITESALEAVMELLREEAKDVRVASFPSGDGPDYTPRHSAARMAEKDIYRRPSTTVRDRDVHGWPDPRWGRRA